MLAVAVVLRELAWRNFDVALICLATSPTRCTVAVVVSNQILARGTVLARARETLVELHITIVVFSLLTSVPGFAEAHVYVRRNKPGGRLHASGTVLTGA